MAELNRPRRPPPPAPMPRLRPPARPAAEARPTIQPLPVDPLVVATRIPEWTPLPLPTLMQNAPPEDDFDPYGNRREPLINRRLAWSGMMSWCWGVVILLLVVSPLAAIPKLMGPFDQPVSGAGYGALLAPFAIIAVVVAFGAGMWLWLAMSHEYASPEDDLTDPL
jgi:hypothetical protein